MIKVRYFGSLKESIGRATDLLVYANSMTVLDVWKTLHDEKSLPENILTAVNMDYVVRSHWVVDEDEVAFFPPVTGG